MDWVNVVSTVGFPIFVAVYLLTRFEKVLRDNTKAVEKLIEKLEK